MIGYFDTIISGAMNKNASADFDFDSFIFERGDVRVVSQTSSSKNIQKILLLVDNRRVYKITNIRFAIDYFGRSID